MYCMKYPHRMAQHVIEKYNSRDPYHISDCEDIIISSPPLPSHVRGMAVNCLGKKYIAINSSLSHSERRIILAHELGHHILHPGMSTRLIMESTLFPLSRFEREAFEFAAYLLIDSALIEYGDTVEMFAYRLSVSAEFIRNYYHVGNAFIS